jgi:hypothetical protein
MSRMIVATMLVLCAACASTQVAKAPPRETVDKLLGLYKDDRTRFVRHIEEMEKSEDCDYITQVKTTAEKMEFDGDIPKDQDRDLKVVMMELQEADKKCRE